jgi:hypothetical protein
VRDHRSVTSAVRGAEVAALQGVLVVVIQVPELARADRLTAARADHLARPDLRGPPLTQPLMRVAVAMIWHQNRGGKCARARSSFFEKFTIQPPPPYLGPGLLLRAATLALTSGVPVHIVAARLGDTPQTVLGTYAHLLPQSDEIAAERVAAALAR